MKGFASKRNKKELYTWVFTKNNFSYETNLKNIGLEKEFYGKPQEIIADEIITKNESKFQNKLNLLQKSESYCEINNDFPIEFIFHLYIRSKHVRDSFKEILDSIICTIINNLKDPARYQEFLINIVRNKPQIIEESLKTEINKIFGPYIPIEYKNYIYEQLNSNVEEFIKLTSSNSYDEFILILNNLKENIQNIVKNAHVDALSKEISFDKLKNKYCNLNWSIHVEKNGEYILGDIGPIGVSEKDNNYTPILFTEETVTDIYLPISNKIIISGNLYKNESLPPFTEINKASASLSNNFFIGCNNSNNEKNLSKIISSNTYFEDKIKPLVEGHIIKELFGT